MTNEQINRAVAEELGWAPRMHLHDGLWSMADNHDNIVGRHSRGGVDADHCWRVCNLDFCTDHNAAAEMRKAIEPEEREAFVRALMFAVASLTSWDLFNASPRQQAEAFLRMRGKWRE